MRRSYEQYRTAQRAGFKGEAKAAAAEGFRVNYLENFDRFVLNREEFERRAAFADYECRKIKYMSDGLKIVGFIWKPSDTTGKKLPLVIVNRGGNANFGLLGPQSFYYPYVTNGLLSSAHSTAARTAARAKTSSEAPTSTTCCI